MLELKIGTRESYLDYLFSHIEIEHIVMDCVDWYKTNKLENLSNEQLEHLAIAYDYLKN